MVGMKVMLTCLHLPTDQVPALSISCLAAHVRQQPELASVRLSVHNWSLDEDPLAQLARVHARQPEVLGLSCYCWNVERSLALCRLVKQLLPRTTVVLGGPQAAPLAAELLATRPAVDHVVCGEGEIAFAGLLSWLAAAGPGDPPAGVWGRREGQLLPGGEAPELAQLDTLQGVFDAAQMPVLGDTVYYETSRGCPNRCAYCYWGRGREGAAVRFASLQRVFADLEVLARRGVRRIYFCDASLCLRRGRAKQILQRVNDDERFEATALDVDAEHLDAELVELLRPKLGELLIGVQTIHDEVLERCGRRWRRRSFEAMVAALRRAQVPFTFQLMYGLPGDDHARMLQSLDYLWSFRPRNIQCFHLQVLPGTRLHQQAGELGLQFDADPPHYLLSGPGYPLEQVLRSRRADNLLRRLCYGFSWPALPWILGDLALSLSAFLEGLCEFLETQQDPERDPDVLLTEMQLWHPVEELALMSEYVGQLCITSPEADLYAGARLGDLLSYHYWLRRTPARAETTPAPEASGTKHAQLAPGVSVRRFTHDVLAMAQQREPAGDQRPAPAPCQLVFYPAGNQARALPISNEEALLLHSFRTPRDASNVIASTPSAARFLRRGILVMLVATA